MEVFETRANLIDAAAAATCATLAEALARGGRATLLCSGGSTPGPLYRELSRCSLDWSLIDVGLADERWVPEAHDASNAGLVRKTLLRREAAEGESVEGKSGEDYAFHPMFEGSASPEDGLADTSGRYGLILPADLLVLGMGPDGHTLSWFPGADGLDLAMDTANDAPVAAITAKPSPVTGDHLQRMTLTASAVRRSRRTLLLITGEDKRAVFENSSEELPVHRLDALLGERLSVYWAP